jgi:hypothetical protein
MVPGNDCPVCPGRTRNRTGTLHGSFPNNKRFEHHLRASILRHQVHHEKWRSPARPCLHGLGHLVQPLDVTSRQTQACGIFCQEEELP